MAKKILMVGKFDMKLEGYSVVGKAPDGKGAISLVRDSDMQKPDLAIIQYKLPDMDGLAVAGKLMQIRPSIAVLLYGIDRRDPEYCKVEKKARELGIRGILRFPFFSKVVPGAVEAALKNPPFSKSECQVFGGIEGDVIRRSTPDELVKLFKRENRTPKNHILLADSSPFLQKTMSAYLGKAGYKIIGIAPAEQECLQMILENRPDMVILDYMEEKDNRLELVRKIRKVDPFIYIVVRIDRQKYPDIEKMAALAVSAGATGAFFSPFEQECLLAEVERLLG